MCNIVQEKATYGLSRIPNLPVTITCFVEDFLSRRNNLNDLIVLYLVLDTATLTRFMFAGQSLDVDIHYYIPTERFTMDDFRADAQTGHVIHETPKRFWRIF